MTSTFLEQAVFTAIWKGNLNGVKTLVDAKNIECFDPEHHRTPLSWACFYGHKTIVPFLIELGANLETRDKHQRTPLLAASYAGHMAIVQLLLDKGANIEAKDELGYTSLMAASTNGFLSVARLLVKKGANVNVISKDGNTCMSLANNGDFKSIVRLLFDAGCNIPQAYQKLGGSKSQSEDQADKDAKQKEIAVVQSASLELDKTKSLELEQTPNNTPIKPPTAIEITPEKPITAAQTIDEADKSIGVAFTREEEVTHSATASKEEGGKLNHPPSEIKEEPAATILPSTERSSTEPTSATDLTNTDAEQVQIELTESPSIAVTEVPTSPKNSPAKLEEGTKPEEKDNAPTPNEAEVHTSPKNSKNSPPKQEEVRKPEETVATPSPNEAEVPISPENSPLKQEEVTKPEETATISSPHEAEVPISPKASPVKQEEVTKTDPVPSPNQATSSSILAEIAATIAQAGDALELEEEGQPVEEEGGEGEEEDEDREDLTNRTSNVTSDRGSLDVPSDGKFPSILHKDSNQDVAFKIKLSDLPDSDDEDDE